MIAVLVKGDLLAIDCHTRKGEHLQKFLWPREQDDKNEDVSIGHLL